MRAPARSPSVGASPDPGLQTLLQIEQQMQARVASARDEAAARVAAARARRDDRLARVANDVDLRDRDAAPKDVDAHRLRLESLRRTHDARLAAIASMAAERLDDLGRRALRMALAIDGDRP